MRISVDLGRRPVRKLALGLLGANLVFTLGTAAFIEEWAHRDWHGPAGQWAIDRLLVQFHLATENVVAAWYSSMLLLSVAVAAVLAFATDRDDRSGLLRWGWLLIAAAFTALSLDELGSLHERIGMIRHGSAAPTGWVYVLLVPILAVALFMTAFAWFRLRRVPAAARLFVAGTALFLSDPVFELFEMSLLRAGRGNDLAVHNALLVVEEGVVELGGALCFLLGVLTYVRRTAGEGPHTFDIAGGRAAQAIATAGLLMTAAVPAAHWLVARLPNGDTGIPDNWFPAAALFLAALLALATRGRRAMPLVAATLALSAAFGASIYGYVPWIGYPAVPLAAAGSAAASLFALQLARRQ